MINTKQFIPMLAVFALCSLLSCVGQVPEKMDFILWGDDLDFLNKKIQKEFKSFNPAAKEKFSLDLKGLQTRLPNLKDYEIKIELMKVVAALQDGHTEINMGQKNAGFHRIPLVLNFFERELYIINAHEKYKHLLGAKVISFNEISTAIVFDQLKEVISHDNEMEFFHAGPSCLILTEIVAYLTGSNQLESSTVTIEKNGETAQTISLTGLNEQEYVKGPWLSYIKANNISIPLYLQNSQKNYWYVYLKENSTFYFHFRKVSNQDGGPSLRKFTKELFDIIDKEKPRKLVIDLRNNTGGNYHLSEPLIDEIKARPWLNQDGKIWVITGKTTFSAALTTCIFLKQETKITLIGEPGRGNPNSSDNVEYMSLPHSKLKVEYTTKIKKHWPELGDVDRIPVDVSVFITFEQYSKGIDPILDQILKQ